MKMHLELKFMIKRSESYISKYTITIKAQLFEFSFIKNDFVLYVISGNATT